MVHSGKNSKLISKVYTHNKKKSRVLSARYRDETTRRGTADQRFRESPDVIKHYNTNMMSLHFLDRAIKNYNVNVMVFFQIE